MSIAIPDEVLRAIQSTVKPQLALVLLLDMSDNSLIDYGVKSLEEVAAIVDGLNSQDNQNQNKTEHRQKES